MTEEAPNEETHQPVMEEQEERDAPRRDGLGKRAGKGLVTENRGIGDDGRGVIHP